MKQIESSWTCQRIGSWHYFEFWSRSWKDDWRIVTSRLQSRQALVIGRLGSGTHSKVFRKAGIQSANVLAEDKDRSYSIVPREELHKLTYEYEFCFSEWPDNAAVADIQMLRDWEYCWADAENTRLSIPFLDRIGSNCLYVYLDGRSTHLLEPEPRIGLDLLREELNDCVGRAHPGTVLELNDRQIGALIQEVRAIITAPQLVKVAPGRIEITVWRWTDSHETEVRKVAFENGEVEVEAWRKHAPQKGLEFMDFPRTSKPMRPWLANLLLILLILALIVAVRSCL